MLLPTLALLLVVSLASGQGTSERPPYYSELEGSEVFDVAIIGCGPSGIQAALVAIQMNLSYVVLEKSDTCGDFFRNYPRRGDLISFNKPNVPIPLEGWDEDNAKDYALRFDWHSMLYGNLTFPPYTTKFYPRAETFVKYLNDVVTHNSINVRYHQEVQEISQRISPNGSGASGGGEVRDHFLADGSSVRSKTTLVATGLKLKPVHKNELKVYKHLFPNAAFFTYEDAPANECEAYTGKHIIIIGNGNAATELSSFIINECAAMRTWVLGKKSLRASHMTHYVGNVRTHNMVIMESYQLKSLDAHWEIPPFGDATEEDLQESMERGMRCAEGRERSTDDCSDPMVPTESDNVVIIFSGGFRSSDGIRLLTDSSEVVFDEENLYKGRYPSLTAFNEVKGCKGVFATGAISHGRDYKESSGGFVHGFRYTTEATMKYLKASMEVSEEVKWTEGAAYTKKSKKWPYKAFKSAIDAEAYIKVRMQSSSALWHLQGFYCDMLFHIPSNNDSESGTNGSIFLYVEQVPVTWEMEIVSKWVLADYIASQRGLSGDEMGLASDEAQVASFDTRRSGTGDRAPLHVATLEQVLVDFLFSEEEEGHGSQDSALSSCFSPPREEDLDQSKVDEGKVEESNFAQVKVELSMLQSCKPFFFDDYEVFVDGEPVSEGFDSLLMKLYSDQVVRIDSLMENKSRTVPVSSVGSSRLGAGRAIFLFEYGDNFKGCDAVYDEVNNAGTGFIAPTIYLERDPRSTPFAWQRNGRGSENLRQWEGWDKITEKEDLFARWREFDRVDAVLDAYFEVSSMENRVPGSSYGRQYSDADGQRDVFGYKLARKSQAFADIFHHGSSPPWENIFDLDLTQVGTY